MAGCIGIWVTTHWSEEIWVTFNRDIFVIQHYAYIAKRRKKLNKVKTYVDIQNVFPTVLHAVWTHCPNCLVFRCLSLDENLPAKEGGKEEKGETKIHCVSSPVTRVLRSPLCEGEVPEEEAAPLTFHFALSPLDNLCIGECKRQH